MTDGYRCGRWECPDTPWHRESLRKLVAGWADKIIGALLDACPECVGMGRVWE